MRNISFSDYLQDYLELEGISQQEFAYSLEINQTQLSLILNKKRELSYKLLEKISMVTPFALKDMIIIQSNYNIEKEIIDKVHKNNDTVKEYIKRYKYKQLESYTQEIKFKNIEDELEVMKDIMKYLRMANPYKNKLSTVRFKSKHNKVELVNIWLEKCYREAKKQNVTTYNKKNLEVVIEHINKFAKTEQFDKDELLHLFNQNGIYLSIVEDMPGSKIRGAFKVLNNKPAVYITLKHKRPADIYFALLHELGHCKTDFNSGKNKTYISIDESMVEEQDKSEEVADHKAYNWMISDTLYTRVLAEFNNTNFYSLIDKYDLAPMFLAYRLASDGKIKYQSKLYQKHNPIMDL